MIIDEGDYLAHYGILRRSGRYPWGSGGPEEASNKGFLEYVKILENQGLSQVQIAKAMGGPDATTTQLRNAKTIARNEIKQQEIHQAQKLRDKGVGASEIGRIMGKNESSIRDLLAPGAADKVRVLDATADILKEEADKGNFVQIGHGVEHFLGVSKTKINNAVAKLQEDGYRVEYVKVPQLGTGQNTSVKVLVKPGVPYTEITNNRDRITVPMHTSIDGGRTFLGIDPPKSISSKRIAIRYAEQGGDKEDGVIHVRPGVDDVSLGGNRYAQVRIAVDGTHFLKGMAVYKDDLPPGVDLRFNTNKSDTGDPKDAMKPMKKTISGQIDQDNPFGAVIKRQHGVMNILDEEGSWGTWSKSLSSQVLSKQRPALAKQQLDMTYERRKNEFDVISKLTNPAVKKKLLEDFAEDADGAAVHLKAAHMPRQASHVIMPVNSLKENEVYAPGYRPGETVVLVRFPHGGIFEIPELKVNNRNPEARKLLGTDSMDVVGINAEVAKRLSGADFDGDTVLVIPNNEGQVKTAPALLGLKSFDPHREFPKYPGMKVMSDNETQTQMGVVSNLITDMTIKRAPQEEMARAIKHSMVVIDAAKHELDYQTSARVNGIASLKEKYQGSKRGGAATLISRAGSKKEVPHRKQGFRVDPTTGKKIFRESGDLTRDKHGNLIPKTQKVKLLEETDDAHTLSSGTPIERIYADHSNRLKTLANQARKDAASIRSVQRSPSAAKVYAKEVEQLGSKLAIAERNAPLERQAQIIANLWVSAKKQDYPDMTKDQLKKVRWQALEEARTRTGASKNKIQITPSEWDAIQAGAVSNKRLTDILKHADLDLVKQYATPRSKRLMTTTKISRAKSMLAAGFTPSEVADQLGVSLTTLKDAMSGGD